MQAAKNKNHIDKKSVIQELQNHSTSRSNNTTKSQVYMLVQFDCYTGIIINPSYSSYFYNMHNSFYARMIDIYNVEKCNSQTKFFKRSNARHMRFNADCF